jgi:hypothetical protein
MELNPAAFNNLLAELGQQVSWRRSDLCPCRDKYSGAAKVGCPVCSAVGVTWGIAIPAYLGIAGMRVKREFAAFGLWESGDVAVTIPCDSPAYDLGENDRVLFSESSEPFRNILTRGVNEVLPFDIVSLDRVFWLDPVTGQQVENDVPPIDPSANMIAWPDLMGPPDGVQYAVRGRKRPEYYVFRELPQDRAHFNGLPLPRRVGLRKFDLFGRSSNG